MVFFLATASNRSIGRSYFKGAQRFALLTAIAHSSLNPEPLLLQNDVILREMQRDTHRKRISEMRVLLNNKRSCSKLGIFIVSEEKKFTKVEEGHSQHQPENAA